MKTLKSFAKPIKKATVASIAKAKALKNVSSGKSGGSKKVSSKVTSAQKNKGESSVKVGVSAPARLSKGMKSPKGFRSPFNQK